MKYNKFAVIIVSVLLVGGGCTTSTQPQNSQAYYDANSYRLAPAASIPIGTAPGYEPADPAPPTTSNPTPPEITDDTTETSVVNQSVKNTVVTQTKTPAPLAYNDALNIYRNHGAYIQFASCSGNPGSISIKRGTKFMIDNRDSVARIYVIGTMQYNVAQYGFAIVTTPLYAGTYYITCNGGGAAALQVQN